MKIEDTISKIIVDSAIEVHRTLGGPGLLESVYEESLAKELELKRFFLCDFAPLRYSFVFVL